jgi:hypothetical protein
VYVPFFPRCPVDCYDEKDITKDPNAAGGSDGKEELRQEERRHDDEGNLGQDEEGGEDLDAEHVVEAEAAALDLAAHFEDRKKTLSRETGFI